MNYNRGAYGRTDVHHKGTKSQRRTKDTIFDAFSIENFKIYQFTTLFIPFLSNATLKFITIPSHAPLNRRYVKSCASWMGSILLTDLSSINIRSLTNKSIRYPQSSFNPLYSTARGTYLSEVMPLSMSSWQRHSS